MAIPEDMEFGEAKIFSFEKPQHTEGARRVSRKRGFDTTPWFRL